MIMLTTTYYVPTTSPSSSATMQLTLGKKNKTHKKNTHKRQLGPFATSTIILSVSEAWQHLFAKKQQQEQSKVGCWLLLSEEFQREWMDQLTLVHHITTLQEK